ncbi:MAG: ABC transporter ATP-binding protein [Chloroflexi bacterium]|nr:ABC transporter ATP-binding protein [Chloroflexota bacterium]
MPSESCGLRLEGVSFNYGAEPVLKDIYLRVEPGEMVACIGPNGSGKTTLLKLAAGVLRPLRGQVHLNGCDMRSLSRRHVAHQVAVMPQLFHIPFAFSVSEVVALGRTPYQRGLAGPSASDYLAVRQAMAQVGLDGLVGRSFQELSGGERQKAVLAMALAQEPQILLLDEPTAHLDIRHQVELLGMVQQLNRKQGLTVLATIHDLNLAALYFPRLVLLHGGRIQADGPPSQVLTVETISGAFGASVQMERHPGGAPHILLLP